jgi:hypothetical protein
VSMKKKVALICLGCVAGVMGYGQNLVNNGGFEQHDTCSSPDAGYGMFPTGWLNLHTQSADYFNVCNTGGILDVPFSQIGYQYPYEGDAYVGMGTTIPGLDWYREIVGITLMEPLQAGVPVCLSFKMAIGGFGSWPGNSAMFTAKGVGMRFFNDFPTDWPAYLYPNSASLSMEVVPMDTAIWYLVSGEYTPDSNYTKLAIGNFFADSLSAITDLDTTGFGALGASYAFIDDVRVSYDLQFCANTGIHSIGEPRNFFAYPNPFVDHITVTLSEPAARQLQWELMDLYGHQVLRGTIVPGAQNTVITANHIAQGPCALRLYDNAGAYAPIRLISVSP